MPKEKPNYYVPFDLDRGCTYNCNCPGCNKPTWMSTNPYQTLCDGFSYTDKYGNYVGILKYGGKQGVYCKDCFEGDIL